MQWPANATITWTISLQQADGTFQPGDTYTFTTTAI